MDRTKDEMQDGPGDRLTRLGKRIEELEGEGLGLSWAMAQAEMELRIAEWPEEWKESLKILIYGDFRQPARELHFESLGITVHPEPRSNTVVGPSLCVLNASVEVSERTLAGLNDAARRINALLGAWTLWGHGNAAFGWWSHLTHGSPSSAIVDLELGRLPETLSTLENLPPEIARKVRSALYWVRDSRAQFTEQHKNNVLRMYAAYWNAFECLVDAVLKRHPQTKLKKKDKEEYLKRLIEERDGALTLSDIDKCYREIVNPGLAGRAKHALVVCFPEHGARYAEECFFRTDKSNRLYDIRNAINHGDIDAENVEGLARVQGRLGLLWRIVWRMFSKFILIPSPIEREQRSAADSGA